jgi:hypothetical protein
VEVGMRTGEAWEADKVMLKVLIFCLKTWSEKCLTTGVIFKQTIFAFDRGVEMRAFLNKGIKIILAILFISSVAKYLSAVIFLFSQKSHYFPNQFSKQLALVLIEFLITIIFLILAWWQTGRIVKFSIKKLNDDGNDIAFSDNKSLNLVLRVMGVGMHPVLTGGLDKL